ncbi:hypothetical protein M2405_004801 [Rhodococcus erythropolis]|uniref:hypothetical protein n=1 Tax=Rhodococcus erythropolis group TaxID=2840174 RepID=UPI0021695B55|nr:MULTISPECIES: hypothetical protein [Rhodococcus erythropolis group]MCS4256490.1 hypothetical protein [Rhodococcus erythropolis]MCW2430819.1 hypothetical protein [Rhodococcus erythropolis]MEA1797701.1 hypothetical protein [Rhodococcus qingshengii]
MTRTSPSEIIADHHRERRHVSARSSAVLHAIATLARTTHRAAVRASQFLGVRAVSGLVAAVRWAHRPRRKPDDRGDGGLLVTTLWPVLGAYVTGTHHRGSPSRSPSGVPSFRVRLPRNTVRKYSGTAVI